MKINLEISRSREFMVKKPFWFFDFYTSKTPCDSSSPPRDKIRPVAPENFSKHGFSFFSPNSSIFFWTLIKVTFWLSNLEKSALRLKHIFWSQVRKILSHKEELVFVKILSVESILSQFFIQFHFSCVNLTYQIFMSSYFTQNFKTLDMIQLGIWDLHPLSRLTSYHCRGSGNSSQPSDSRNMSDTNLQKYSILIRLSLEK